MKSQGRGDGGSKENKVGHGDTVEGTENAFKGKGGRERI